MSCSLSLRPSYGISGLAVCGFWELGGSLDEERKETSEQRQELEDQR